MQRTKGLGKNLMQLRDYQLECIESIWAELLKESVALAVCPTGSGKTLTFAHLLKKALAVKPTLRAAILMGRVDLVAQTERAISRVLEPRLLGVYCGSLGRKELNRQVIIGSIQSLSHVDIPHLDLLILDEVHNLNQGDGTYLKTLDKARLKNPKLKIVGFTATPYRATGEIFGEGMLFPRICYRKTIQEMIDLGYLCEPKMKGSKDAFDVSQLRVRAGEYVLEDVAKLVSDEVLVSRQVEDALSRIKDRTCVAWATATIAHCNLVANDLMNRGELVTTVHSKLSKQTRDSNLAAFKSGIVTHIVFVTILSEGFDFPPIDTIILMRPTKSAVLYVQTCGRGLRPYQTKKDCVVLDYGKVIETLGPLDNPKVKNKRKGEGEAVLKECSSCYSYVFGGLRFCPECGHEFPPLPTAVQKLEKVAKEGIILSAKVEPTVEQVGPVFISMHTAKSGNECVKITYSDGNLMSRYRGGTAEFYVTSSPWSLDRLERRLTDLRATLPSIPFPGEVIVDGLFEVVKTMEGRYERVLSVKRIADRAPRAKTYLDDLDDGGDDTSFNFGANRRGVIDDGMGAGQ